MKNILNSALFIVAITGSVALQSCQKTETLKAPSATLTFSNKNTSGGGSSYSGGVNGGGSSGGGHNGGSGGGSTAPTSPLAPADTATSLLPIGDIITVGHWKITSFTQGNDNNASLFASYSFTFNPDGSVIADDGNGNLSTGYWHYQEAVFYYGLPVYGSSPYGFTMAFSSGLPLMMLNENFFISKKTLTTVSIDSVNPNENAHITFSKLAQ